MHASHVVYCVCDGNLNILCFTREQYAIVYVHSLHTCSSYSVHCLFVNNNSNIIFLCSTFHQTMISKHFTIRQCFYTLCEYKVCIVYTFVYLGNLVCCMYMYEIRGDAGEHENCLFFAVGTFMQCVILNVPWLLDK